MVNLRYSISRAITVVGAVLMLCAGVTASAQAAGPPWLYWSNVDSAKPLSIARSTLQGTDRSGEFIKVPSNPYGIFVNSSHIFWGEHSSGTIARANLDGSSVNRNFVSGASAPTDVFADDDYIYWANNKKGTIGRAKIDGTGVNQKFITGVKNIYSVWASTEYIYWGRGRTGWFPWTKEPSAIGRAKLNGSAVERDFITGNAVRGPGALVTDSNYVYWANSVGDSTIARARLDGRSVVDPFIVSGPRDSTPYGLAISGEHLYWTLYDTNRVGRANIDGSGTNFNFIVNPSPKRKGPGSITLTEDRLSVSLAGSGSGRVGSVPDGIDCPGDCGEDFADGELVTLSAVAADNSRFAGWSGDCSGRAPTCTVKMSRAESVTASFEVLPPASHELSVKRSGAGVGEVTSTPAGISCGNDCVQGFTEGTAVTLTPTPDDESRFTGWSGACSGEHACTVLMTEARAVTANFEPLPPSTYQLRVANLGTGIGTVKSDPTGIDCGTDCVQGFTAGSLITLTATPADGSSFARWGGACSGTGPCVVEMDQARSVTATFQALPPERFNLNVQPTGTGAGLVTSEPAGIYCGPDCRQAFTAGTTVALQATPDDSSDFTGWGGSCSGTQEICTVTMSQVRNVTAGFDDLPVTSKVLSVSTAGSGAGKVRSDPAGIDCGGDCRQGFPQGANVTLAATPDDNSSFSGWSGACSGASETCTVTMDEARDVTASFETLPADAFLLTVDASDTGFGSVVSSPAGIRCGSDCVQKFAANSTVTLTSDALPDGSFDGWSGACAGGLFRCSVTMSRAITVGAAFVANNRFVVDSTKRAKTAVQTRVTVPGAGRMTQTGTRTALNGLTVRACSGSKLLTRAGSFTLSCKLSTSTIRRLRKHSVRVRLSTTYNPDESGSLRTIIRTIRLPARGSGVNG
jgi:uncharacterized protein (DUF2141 family)